MRWFKLKLQAAGLGHLMPMRLLGFWLVGLFVVAAVLVRITGLVAVGFAAFFLGAALSVELLALRARGRENTLVAVLPQICESLSSAVNTGLDLQVAFGDLAVAGPKQTRASLAAFSELLNRGVQFEQALDWLKVELSQADADQLIELIRLSRTSGGIGLASNLARLGEALRKQAALNGELSAKQGWVTGTAKLALATPWLTVVMLGSRPENARIYNSNLGMLALGAGLLMCLGAYAVINAVSGLPRPKRVFAA